MREVSRERGAPVGNMVRRAIASWLQAQRFGGKKRGNTNPAFPIEYASTMGIVVKQKECELPTEGLHTAVISRIEDLGIVETANGKKDKARIFFTIFDEKAKHKTDAEVFMSINPQ